MKSALFSEMQISGGVFCNLPKIVNGIFLLIQATCLCFKMASMEEKNAIFVLVAL